MRPCRFPVLLALCALAAGAFARESSAQGVRLVDWDGPAHLVRGGPGRPLFELSARVQWPRQASGRYAVRVALPDGQIETQPMPMPEGSPPLRLTVYVPAATVRNRRPSAVWARASVVDLATNAEVSNALVATIEDFPRPRTEGRGVDVGPFGWGTPLSGPPGQARTLPRPGPDDWRFVRIPATGDRPAFFLATTEATNAQVARRLPGYDPRAGRSDEFLLEDPGQPAIGLTPKQAGAYLAAMSRADRSGVVYRLPSVEEWLRAARAGRSTFWWGDEPSHPAGANFLGPEPALERDTTAPSRPAAGGPRFEANPWGILHGFGNVAEWAATPSGGFARLGGHFRTEPAAPLPEVAVEADDSTGPDPYVGLRPAFDLPAQAGSALATRALRVDPRLVLVSVAYDPDRGSATLTGTLPEASLRRRADELLAPLWFLAAVVNRIATPTFVPGQLALLGGVAGKARKITPLGRWAYEVPIEVRWADPLPVSGSDWWVNLYLPTGGHAAHRMIEPEPDRAGRVTVLVDRARMAAAGLAVDAPISVALSLGAEAASPADPRVVSNVVPLRWRAP